MMLVENLKELKSRIDTFGKSGMIEVDILYKAIDLLEKHKNIKVFPEDLEIQIMPWADPLNNDEQIIVIHTVVRAELENQAPLAFMDNIDFRFFRKSFIPIQFDTDTDKLKSIYKKIPDEDYAALRIMGEMCERIKAAKEKYLLERQYISTDIWQTITGAKTLTSPDGWYVKFK